jgi:tRNA(His) 5'-end guanylyltransferase
MKKTELRQIIREIITEVSNKEKTQFRDYLAAKYRNKDVVGYTLTNDDDELVWSEMGIEVNATPYWEDKIGLIIGIKLSSQYNRMETVYNKVFKFKWDSDYTKMESEYFRILTPILKKFK